MKNLYDIKKLEVVLNESDNSVSIKANINDMLSHYDEFPEEGSCPVVSVLMDLLEAGNSVIGDVEHKKTEVK